MKNPPAKRSALVKTRKQEILVAAIFTTLVVFVVTFLVGSGALRSALSAAVVGAAGVIIFVVLTNRNLRRQVGRDE